MSTFTTPVVTSMQIIPVAGHDSMLMNLSGAHAPYFTRNIVIIKDNAGHTGVGEIPGGEKIRTTLEDAIPLTPEMIRELARRYGEVRRAQEESVAIWNEFFSRYSRGADGTLYYQGNAVTAGKHQPSADWYAAK